MHSEVVIGWLNDLHVAFHHCADAFACSRLVTHRKPRASYSTRVSNPQKRRRIPREVCLNQIHDMAENSKKRGVEWSQIREDSYSDVTLQALGSQSRGHGLLEDENRVITTAIYCQRSLQKLYSGPYYGDTLNGVSDEFFDIQIRQDILEDSPDDRFTTPRTSRTRFPRQEYPSDSAPARNFVRSLKVP